MRPVLSESRKMKMLTDSILNFDYYYRKVKLIQVFLKFDDNTQYLQWGMIFLEIISLNLC